MITVKPGPNNADYPNPDNADSVRAWFLGSAAAWAARETIRVYNEYVAAFNVWLGNYNNLVVNEPPPAPPDGFVGQISDDGISSVGLADSGQPCGPIPAYTKRPAPVGSSGSIRSGLPPALLVGKIGQQVTQFDGTVWERKA